MTPKGQQINIALNGPIDIESEGIVVTEQASYDKKNSIVYQGVLSNLTSKKGAGLLSTNGKTITVDEKGIHTGDITIPLPNTIDVATNYQSIESFADILFARRLDTGLAYIRRPTNTSLRIHTPITEFDVYADDEVILTIDGNKYTALPYSINGFITQNRSGATGFENPNLVLVTKHYYSVECGHYYNKYLLYKVDGTLLHTWEDSYYGSDNLMTTGNEWFAPGDKLTGYVRTEENDDIIYNYIYWGFDDNDMRKRFIVRTYYYWDRKANGHPIYDIDAEDDTNPNQRHLFIDDNPSTLRETYSSDGYIYSGRVSAELNGNIESNWGVKPIVHGFGLISDKGYVTGEPLVEKHDINQTFENKRSRGLFNSEYRELNNGVVVSEVNINSKRRFNGSAYVTDSITRPAMNAGLGNNPTTYMSGSQSGASNWVDVDFRTYVNDNEEEITGYSYDWILSINLNNGEDYQTIPALEYSNGFNHITFFNFSDPFGKFSNNPSDDVQVFPHLRFFMNVQEDRGKYWDYGKGWNVMTVDQIYVKKYSSYGVALFEAPLSLVYNTAENKFSDNLNIVDHKYDQKYLRLLDSVKYESKVEGDIPDIVSELPRLDLTNTAYPSNNKNKAIFETEFQVAFKRTLVGTEYQLWYQVLRLHDIDTNMRSESNVYYSNHSWTGFADNSTLQVLTHTFKLEDNVDLGVYSEVPTCLSAYNTLLFTPQDLDVNYSIDAYGDGNYYIARYNHDSIESVDIKHNATYEDVVIEKCADYEFRTNLLGVKNLIVEDHYGNFSIERAFYPYLMDTYFNNYYDMSLPIDSTTNANNATWYYGAGFNVNLNGDTAETSTFLLPAILLQCYISTSEIDSFNKYALDNRNGKLIADMWCFSGGDYIDEYYTMNRATTDILYKNTKFIDNALIAGNRFDVEKDNTSWWLSNDVVIYPIGIVSKVEGVNYTTPTVDAGNNYSARFYRANNKTFLNFNQKDMVYFGDRIFTIMSGNYYFDGQGIYYLGSRDDYSQNIFTAYAIGMKFLANSSAEAYFYSEWDKSLYLYTASNTLQRSQSFAKMGKVIDSLYSSAEQALYILFEDGNLYVKTQLDSMIITGVKGNKLQSTSYGCQILGDDGFEMYNPHNLSEIEELELETEWLGNPDSIQRYPYADIVLLDNKQESTPTFEVEFLTLNGGIIESKTQQFMVTKDSWKNQLSRWRAVPYQPDGNAFKLRIRAKDYIRIASISVRVDKVSDIPSAPRGQRG